MSTTPPAVKPSRSRLKLPVISQGSQETIIIFACLALFLIYGSFRQRYIWGVDSFGYYQLGQLFSEGRVYLDSHLLSMNEPALVPFGFSINAAGHAVPNYPPGFPLLIAIGHLLRAPMWVTPFIGVVSCVVLFGLLRDRVRPITAWLFTLAWAFMPQTVFGSTMLMSDLVAATTIMGGLLAFQRNRIVLAAWIFGLSIVIRPTNVLFFAPFALLLKPDRRALKLILHLAVPCAIYAFYNYSLYGAPWKTGYGQISANMKASVFPAFFSFFTKTTVVMLTPVIAGLAVIGLAPWNREKLFLVLWPLTFVVFYSFWEGGGNDRWWWTRFILPGYGALFILAAQGFESTQRWCDRRLTLRYAKISRIALIVTVLALPYYYIRFGLAQNDLWQRTTGATNYEVVKRVSAIAPPGSLVGSLELASTFILYSELTPFIPVNSNAPDLIARTLSAGHRVFILPEPWNTSDSVVVTLMQRFQPTEIARYEFLWGGLPVYELTAR